MAFNVIGIGEVLWDLLPAGRQLGGAPANFAYHAHALGAQACVISRIGRDDLGAEVLLRLSQLGLIVNTIQTDEEAPTGTVGVSLNDAGHPDYIIREGAAWDHLAITPAALEALSRAHAICFGTLAQRTPNNREVIGRFLKAAPSHALLVLDLNLRQQYYTRELIEASLQSANVLKLNESELDCLAPMFELRGDARSHISELARVFSLSVVACTRGQHGSLILAQDCWSDHPGVSTNVVDTVGAGDAFTAAMTLGLLARLDLDKVSQQANEVAAYVASCAGATPTLPERLTSRRKPAS